MSGKVDLATACVTHAVIEQVGRVGASQKQIALNNVTSGSRRNPVLVALKAYGKVYRLIVADTHAAWRNHQTADFIGDFDDLYEQLTHTPSLRVPVQELALEP